MGRVLRLALIALVGVASWTAVPHGQRVPTLSEDLKGALALGRGGRVIVQADDATRRVLKGRYAHGLERELTDALVLNVTPVELGALVRNAGIAHLSGDLPVTADMAVTNSSTRADKVWSGGSSLGGLWSSPGYTGAGVGVAVIDSGIADHPALSDRVVARVNFVRTEPGVSGDPFGHGTHVAGIIAGDGGAAAKVTKAYGGAPRLARA